MLLSKQFSLNRGSGYSYQATLISAGLNSVDIFVDDPYTRHGHTKTKSTQIYEKYTRISTFKPVFYRKKIL